MTPIMPMQKKTTVICILQLLKINIDIRMMFTVLQLVRSGVFMCFNPVADVIFNQVCMVMVKSGVFECGVLCVMLSADYGAIVIRFILFVAGANEFFGICGYCGEAVLGV